MRVWDIPVTQLCNKHLIAQHHEIHCIYSIIVNNKKGFAHHPEVMRWRDRLYCLVRTHDNTAFEMRLRGLNHRTMLDESIINPIGQKVIVNKEAETSIWQMAQEPPEPWQPIEVQKQILLSKNCGCLRNEKDSPII